VGRTWRGWTSSFSESSDLTTPDVLAELGVAPPRQFAGHSWSLYEVQNERMIVESTFQPLNRRRFIRVSAALGLLAGLQRSRNCPYGPPK